MFFKLKHYTREPPTPYTSQILFTLKKPGILGKPGNPRSDAVFHLGTGRSQPGQPGHNATNWVYLPRFLPIVTKSNQYWCLKVPNPQISRPFKKHLTARHSCHDPRDAIPPGPVGVAAARRPRGLCPVACPVASVRLSAAPRRRPGLSPLSLPLSVSVACRLSHVYVRA